jgi:hypothetical protein
MTLAMAQHLCHPGGAGQARCALCGKTATAFTTDLRLLPTVTTYVDVDSGDDKAMAHWLGITPPRFSCDEHRTARRYDLMGKRMPPEMWDLIDKGFAWSAAGDDDDHGFILGRWEG